MFQTIGNGTFHLGDCLEVMKQCPDGVVDMILCDLPYGTTACKWDTIIPFGELWEQYWRIAKPNAAVVLTASQPFTSALVMSQVDKFKCCWYWNKDKAGNFATAKFNPLKVVEDICVFGRKITYNPQMTDANDKNKRPRDRIDNVSSPIDGMSSGSYAPSADRDENKRFPKTLINIPSTTGELNNRRRLHPTQKPVELFEYLIKTYSNEGDLVLDNCAGSGTTAIAAENMGRRWVCIEKDEEYANKAIGRIKSHLGLKAAV